MGGVKEVVASGQNLPGTNASFCTELHIQAGYQQLMTHRARPRDMTPVSKFLRVVRQES
jgi:hypothetical protein